MPSPHDPVVTLDTVYKRSDRIVARRIAGEFILVPLVGRGANLDSIYSLNRVGTFIWDRLDGSRSLREICDSIVAEFDVPADRALADLLEFVATLKKKGLVI